MRTDMSQPEKGGAPSMSSEPPVGGEGFANAEPRLRVSVVPGSKSGSWVRDALDELASEADSVALEQIAVLVGALTSEEEPGEQSRTPIDLRLWIESTGVTVELRDRNFSLHRSEGGLVELERSMVSNWRLKLVERLADRWSVSHDDELTLRFEFDREPPEGGERHLVRSGQADGALRLEEQLHPPIGGWGSILEDGRSGDGESRQNGGHSPGYD
jgi:hypothetical protein